MMSVLEFRNDDAGYLAWRAAHPAGYVANVVAQGHSYVKLHAVKHNLSNRGFSHPHARTHTYKKLVSEDLGALTAAVVAAGYPPQSFKECKVCRLGTAGVSRFRPTANADDLLRATAELLVFPVIARPPGNPKPRPTTRAARDYPRCPRVRAWVLLQARGICEACHNRAPFLDASGRPFLELHHVVTLAEGGKDTTDNCIALCPNCHRRAHWAHDAVRFARDLRNAVRQRKA